MAYYLGYTDLDELIASLGSSEKLAPYLLYLDSEAGIKKKIKVSSLIEFIDSLFDQYQNEVYTDSIYQSFIELDIDELFEFLEYDESIRKLIKDFLKNKSETI